MPETGARRRGPKPTAARILAVRVLNRVDRVRSYADLALHHALAQSSLSAADRGLATELVYGTLRWRGRLDYALERALERPLNEIEPLVLTILRVGAYQLMFSDRIPDSAAVDESVRCARAVGADRATGLVNAVLRRTARERGALEWPELSQDPMGHLVHALSLPPWLAERWLSDYGAEDAAALAEASNKPPPLTVRTNPFHGDRNRLAEALRTLFPETRPCRYASRGLVLGHGGDPGRDPRFRNGEYSVQDEASQLVSELLDVHPGQSVLDVCAAPGSKTTALAENLGSDTGHVLALDRHTNRLALVARAARRLGLVGIHTLVRDATRPLTDLPVPASSEPHDDSRPMAFDRVLVDAPCSGLGAIRRNPDARWRIRPEDPQRLAGVQNKLLDRAAEVTAPGGRLVYSVCTVLREENEEVVDLFLRRNPAFQRDPSRPSIAHVDELLDAVGDMRCYPHRHGTDGFYAARLLRIG
ncbi:16S rRNA (cytosine(967)-C(5))-methyltransferase RsmB [Myxococcota bacterium]|nr:16S rRNA (cytosine(967)-C(5))-methyltransferase RsmB [Myxococcota bacterium]